MKSIKDGLAKILAKYIFDEDCHDGSKQLGRS